MTAQPHAQNITHELTDNVIAENVSEAMYLDVFADYHTEWVNGKVIKLPPMNIYQDDLRFSLRVFHELYFELLSPDPLGYTVALPFLLRLGNIKSYRKPYVMIILNSNPKTLHDEDIYMDGAPDVVIEIATLETAHSIYGRKFHEYEVSGVPEYWIFDLEGHITTFFRLNDEGRYVRMKTQPDGSYCTPLLPKLHVQPDWLWGDKPLGIRQLIPLITAMLNDQDETE